MKLSKELKSLGVALVVAATGLGLSFGAGAMLRTISNRTDPASTSSPGPRMVAAAPVGGESIRRGQSLFLKNCAHCHAEDAHGDEGPDLHGLKRSDDWIKRRIQNGVKGEMTAFGEKFSADDLQALVGYLRTLK